jgi:hypothetical protein
VGCLVGCKNFSQKRHGFCGSGRGGGEGQQLGQFFTVEPESVATGAPIQMQYRLVRGVDCDFFKQRVAPGTQMFFAGGCGTGLFEKFEDGVIGVFEQGFQLAGVEPDAPALFTVIHFHIAQMRDEQGNVAFWTDGYHASQGAA